MSDPAAVNTHIYAASAVDAALYTHIDAASTSAVDAAVHTPIDSGTTAVVSAATAAAVLTPIDTAVQCLSQDLETGCLKLAVVKFLGVHILGGSQYTHISTINMYKFIKIRLDIIKQCHGNYREMKKLNHSLRLGFLEIPHKNIWVSLGVLFKGLGVQKGTQTPCWLGPCCSTYSN